MIVSGDRGRLGWLEPETRVALEGLVARVDRGYRGQRAIDGALQFECTGDSRTGGCSGLFHLSFEDGRVELRDGGHDAPEAAVRLDVELLGAWLSDATRFDFRVPAVARRVHVRGDPRWLEVASELARVPPPAFTARLLLAARLARRRPVHVVERVGRPGWPLVQECLSQGRPIVATGLLEGWPRRGAELDAALASAGLQLVPAATTVLALMAPARAKSFDRFRMYSSGYELPAELRGRFPQPYAESLACAPPLLWAGATPEPERPVTPLHRDVPHVLLAHVLGRKRFTLYSADQATNLYPYAGHSMYQLCWADPGAPDLQRHPLIADARAIEVWLEPGELLVLPGGWFHEVYAPEPVLSISFSSLAVIPDLAAAAR